MPLTCSLFPICLEWGFMLSPVACIWLRELPTWTCSRGEWRSTSVVSYMFDVTQQRAFSLEAPRCEKKTTTQHSYKLRMQCQLSALLTFPPLSFSLMPVKETSRQRKWNRETQELISVRRQDSGRRKKKERKSEWQLTACPSHVSLSVTPSSVTPTRHTCTQPECMHFDHFSKQVPELDYNLKSGSNSWDDNWLCLFSSWHLRNHLNAAETTVWRLMMQIHRLYCCLKNGNSSVTNNQYTISHFSHVMWLVRDSFT